MIPRGGRVRGGARAFWHARPSRGLAAEALAVGAVAALGQAPLGWWFLAFPAFVVLVALVARAPGAWAAFWIAGLAGAGYFATALHWIVFPFFVDPVRHGWMAPFALVLLAAGLGLFWAMAGALAHRMRGGALGFGALWALAELARSHLFTGFPWALPGHIWAESPLDQMPALIGSYGVTVATCLAAALPVALGRWALVGLVPLAMAGLGWNAHRLSLPEPPARAAVVRLVQPAAEQHLKWAPDWAERNFAALLALTRQDPAPGMGRPDLVIWPETSVPYLVEEGGTIARAIAEAGQGAPVAAGIQRVVGPKGWNTLAVIAGEGRIGAHYDKHHLVPFGEYVPFGDRLFDWFGISAFAAQVGAGYSAGTGPQILDMGPVLGRVLPLICYEAIFPQDIARAPGRADWMLQITNDAWFGPWAGPAQHAALSRLRAIEQGLPLVRVGNTGISAVLDGRGRVTGAAPDAPHRLALGVAGVIDAPVPGALAPTPYARLGEAGTLGLLLAGFALGLIRARRPNIA